MGKKKEEKLTAEAEAVESTEEEILEEGQAEASAEAEAGEPEVQDVDYQAEADQNKDLYLRALADLENYRKRAQREKEDAIRFANSNLLREMIPVLDNLERAVEHANGNGDQGLLEGVQMTLDQFRKVLEGFGVKIIESIGEPFNPEFHQAMGELVTADYEPGSVAQELQKAYTLNGRLLRPAMVMVAKAPDVTEESEDAVAGTEDNIEKVDESASEKDSDEN